MTTALNGFEETKIWPANPSVFPDVDFLPLQIIELESTQTGLIEKENTRTPTSDLSQIQLVFN